MKKLSLALAAAAGIAAISAQANEFTVPNFGLANAVINAIQTPQTANRITWKVGDFHKISVEMGSFGALGQGTKSVTKEETAQNAIWYVQDLNVMGQAQKVETLMSRVDGKVLKQIVNGKEETPSEGDSKIDIIEQSETTITVPAGKFDCMYVKAKITQKNQQPTDVELWINPNQVNLDGTLKMTIQSAQGAISLILQEFGPK